MEYVKTQLLQSVMQNYSVVGWDLTLSHACITHDDVLLNTLLRVDLHFRIMKATKTTIDVTPTLKLDWVQKEDGSIEKCGEKV